MSPPKALPIIIGIMMPLFFSLGLAPLLAAVSNPNDNIRRLEIWVASFDSATPTPIIGNSFLAAVSGLMSSSAPVPSFVIKDPTLVTKERLQQAVKDGEAWGAIWVNSDSTSNLLTTLSTVSSGGAAATTAAANYDANKAITFLFDEARNNIVMARVLGGTRSFLNRYAATAATQIMGSTITQAGANAGTVLSMTATVKASLLSAPIGFSEVSIAPFDIPLISTAQLLGNILMMVFGLAIANVIIGPIQMFTAKLQPLHRFLFRSACIIGYAATVSAAFVTIVVGLANTHATGSEAHYTGNGEQWAQLWTLFWLSLCIFAFFFTAVGVHLGPPAIPAFLLLVLLWNVIAGFNTDLADSGFRFFWYAPVYHSAIVLRSVLFGSGDNLVSRSVGILWLWMFIDIALFMGASYKAEQKLKNAKMLSGAPAGTPPTHTTGETIVAKVEEVLEAAELGIGSSSVGEGK